MKFRVDINTPIGVFYRYVKQDNINSVEDITKDLEKLINMDYVLWNVDEENETALILYKDVWKNSIVEIHKLYKLSTN